MAFCPTKKSTPAVIRTSAEPRGHTDKENRRDTAHNAQLAARYTQHTPGSDLGATTQRFTSTQDQTRHKTQVKTQRRNDTTSSVKIQDYAALF